MSKLLRLADNEIFFLSPVSGFLLSHWSQVTAKSGIQEFWSCESTYVRAYFQTRDSIAQLKPLETCSWSFLGVTVPFQARLFFAQHLLWQQIHLRDLERSSGSAAHMLLVNIERAFLKKNVCRSTLSRAIWVHHNWCCHCAAAALSPQKKKDFLEQEETVIINKDGREALEDTCTRVTNFRWLSVICIFCIQIKDYKGSYKLIQGQVFFSSSELAVPEHKYAVS